MKWKGRWQNWSWGFLRVAISGIRWSRLLRMPCSAASRSSSTIWRCGAYPHAYVEDLTARGVGEIDRLIQKYRMPVKCFTPEHNGYPFNYMAGDEFQWERSMVYLEKAIELTAAMGAPMMLFSAGCRYRRLMRDFRKVWNV